VTTVYLDHVSKAGTDKLSESLTDDYAGLLGLADAGETIA